MSPTPEYTDELIIRIDTPQSYFPNWQVWVARTACPPVPPKTNVITGQLLAADFRLLATGI
jgi:hypothetical protein